jgi:ABC-type uncharacterized transport system involved in gliding motility auxiliary subunit
MGRRVGLIGGILVLIVLFFALNMLASVGVRSARLDLTESKAFTLTSGSRAIAKSFDVKEPVTLTLYYSAKVARNRPELKTYYDRVHELLEEYERAAKGGIKLVVVDPEPFSEAEDTAVEKGLQGLQLGPANAYLGLVGTNSVNTTEVIPFFDPRQERFLEYDISRLLYSLQHPTKKKVGLISSLQIQGGFTFDPQTRQPRRTPAWQAIEEVRKQFELKPMGASIKVVPDDIDVLMLVHPQKLDDATLYAIDQFVMRGGKLLAFVDPLCENQESPQQQQGQTIDRASHLEKLLDAWGVEVVPGKFAADKTLALEVRMPGANGRPELVQFVGWLGLKPDQMAKDDPIVGDLSLLHLATAGSIRAKKPAPPAPGQTPPPEPPHATITPLLHTTTQSMEMPTEVMSMQPDPRTMLKLFVAGNEELVLAARLGGEVPSAFPNGAPAPADAASPPPAPGLTKSTGPINVVLVADADMLADGMWMRQQEIFGAMKFADNGDFVVNAIDNLSGSTELMSVRARKTEQRPFEVVDKMRRSAQLELQSKEDELNKKLEDTRANMQKLQAQKGKDNQFVLSADQQKELEKIRDEFASTNKQLRQVRLSLNKDVENLGTRLKFINIGLIPLVVALGALGLGAVRAARRRSVAKRA